MIARTAVLAVLVLSAVAAHATPYDYCLTCHGGGANGNVAIQAPRVSALPPWYLRAQLEAFRAGWRCSHAEDAPGHEMRPVGQHLDAPGVDGAIAFLRSLPTRRPSPTVQGDAARGAQLYASCVACHGDSGQGNETLHAPPLAGQTDWYLLSGLRRFRAGVRGSAAGDVNGAAMRAATAPLPADDAALADLVAYLNTLPEPGSR